MKIPYLWSVSLNNGRISSCLDTRKWPVNSLRLPIKMNLALSYLNIDRTCQDYGVLIGPSHTQIRHRFYVPQ